MRTGREMKAALAYALVVRLLKKAVIKNQDNMRFILDNGLLMF